MKWYCIYFYDWLNGGDWILIEAYLSSSKADQRALMLARLSSELYKIEIIYSIENPCTAILPLDEKLTDWDE
jgi:hypothetical protein